MTNEEARSILYSIDRFSYVDMISLLGQDACHIDYAGKEGIIVRPDKDFMSVASFTDWHEILPYIDTSCSLICVHEEGLRNYLMEHYGYENKEGCYSYSWWGGPFQIEDNDIRILSSDYLETITSVYAIDSEDSIRQLLADGRIAGLFIGDKLAGFVGFHSEGSMGMLQIFDEYRKHGYGELLEKYDINWALSEGRIPYCHVFFSNKASINLQNKLGLVRGDKPIWWIWKE